MNSRLSFLAYEIYKLKWKEEHGITYKDEAELVLNYGLSLEECLTQFGFPQGIYVSYDEFLANEYEEPECMQQLLPEELYAQYLKERRSGLLWETLIEITWVFDRLVQGGQVKALGEVDSKEIKATIREMAKEFEEQFASEDWDTSEFVYEEEVEKFARKRFIEVLDPPIVQKGKARICYLLCKLLQRTRGASDLVSLELDENQEYVTATFKDGWHKKIDVMADSEFALIKDIVNHLGV